MWLKFVKLKYYCLNPKFLSMGRYSFSTPITLYAPNSRRKGYSTLNFSKFAGFCFNRSKSSSGLYVARTASSITFFELLKSIISFLGVALLGVNSISTPKNFATSSTEVREPLNLPSSEYPAMCEVAINASSINGTYIPLGSFSHVSTTKSEIFPSCFAWYSALSSTTPPLALLIKSGFRASELKKLLS